jgi:hypothetical protein
MLQFYDIVESMNKHKRQRADSRQDMVVTTVALPRALHARLRKLAVDEGTVLTQYVREALQEWLERRKGGKR